MSYCFIDSVHFDIRGKALAWFTSYLTGHRQYVTIRGADSSCSVMYGVPQGSVLRPLLYLLYTTSVGGHCSETWNDVPLLCRQLIFSFYSNTPELVTASRLEACVKDVSDWMSSNKLKLNSDKTELLIASQFCPKPQLSSLNVCGDQINPSVF